MIKNTSFENFDNNSLEDNQDTMIVKNVPETNTQSNLNNFISKYKKVNERMNKE